MNLSHRLSQPSMLSPPDEHSSIKKWQQKDDPNSISIIEGFHDKRLSDLGKDSTIPSFRNDVRKHTESPMEYRKNVRKNNKYQYPYKSYENETIEDYMRRTGIPFSQ